MLSVLPQAVLGNLACGPSRVTLEGVSQVLGAVADDPASLEVVHQGWE